MPMFYCNHYNTNLTQDCPPVKETRCIGGKQKENVKDYSQKWLEEQAQSLNDKTTAVIQ